MPNLGELKQRNKPDIPESSQSLQPQQTVTIPYLPQVSAIPTDQWNMMLESQTAAIQRLQELAAYISTLPTVDDVNKMMKNYYQNIYDRQTDHLSNTIRKEHQRIMENMTSSMEKTTDTIGRKMTNTLEDWEKKLRHRDMSPLKMKAKWVGIGALTSTILWLLLRLLTTL